MLAAHDPVETLQSLLGRITQARRTTDSLFDILNDASLYERPIPERHRIVFYIGHLEAFDRNLLQGRLLSLPETSREFDRLFAFGIDPVGGGLPADQPSDWPAIETVRAYVQRVRGEIDEELAGLTEGGAAGEGSADLLLNVAVEHRLMHAETLSYMLHRLPYDRKNAPPGVPQLVSVPGPSEMAEIPRGPATLGLSRNGATFGWDNEFEQQTVDVPEFAIDRYKVTNAEYLDFVDAGGYGDRRYWTGPAWQWKESQRISHPAFWEWKGGEWFWRGMFREIPLPADWPVYVSHAEASAFARWSGKGLPTEAQWQRAAYGSPGSQARRYPWGAKPPDAARGNFDFAQWDPMPVSAHPAGVSAFGVEDILGNGWEWTATEFGPFAGFQPFPFYPGYSADFFDGQHYVLKGASARTAACMLRPSFRNWFQPHYQYVYAGFRCVSRPPA